MKRDAAYRERPGREADEQGDSDEMKHTGQDHANVAAAPHQRAATPTRRLTVFLPFDPIGCSGDPTPEPGDPIGGPLGAVPAPAFRFACAAVGEPAGPAVVGVWLFTCELKLPVVPVPSLEFRRSLSPSWQRHW